MSCTQTKTITTHTKVKITRLTANKPKQINGFNYKSAPPDEHLQAYKLAIANHKFHFQELSDLFHQLYPFPPYTANNFLDFLKNYLGISTTVIEFENKTTTDIKGAWFWENDNRDSIVIKIASHLTYAEKKLCILHEAFHAIQDLDPSFIAIMQTIPMPIRRMVADRIAELSAIETVLPRTKFEKYKYRKNMSNSEIMELFQVSNSLVRYQ